MNTKNPYYINTPMYKLSPMCNFCKMYPCPYQTSIPMYSPDFMRGFDNSSNAEEGSVKDFISNLEERGFIVQEGELRYYDVLKLVSRGLIDTAFANNAGAPYASYILPPAPNQQPLIGQRPPKIYNPDSPDNYPPNVIYGTPGTYYKLRPDEAIVLIGQTPPPAYYFSFRSYLGFAGNKPDKDYSDTITTGNAETGPYHFIGASMGNQINNYRIKTDNTPDSPFNSNTIIITTADRNINRQMRDALSESGFREDIMNDDNIPIGLVNMGLEKGKDNFSFLMRASNWIDYDAGWNYIYNLKDYTKVLRITPKTPSSTINPWPVPDLGIRETGTTEFQTAQNARRELDYLRNQIIKKYGSEGYDHVDLKSNFWILEGYEGIFQDVPVYFDNRDAVYLKTDNFKLETDDDFVIIYGVNHLQTGKATFFNTSFYGAEHWNGVVGANITNESQSNYSAKEYFPSNYENSNFYYVLKMARKKEEGNEAIIPYSTGNPQGSAYGVDNNEEAYVGFRIYLDKETKLGPAPFDIIWDHAILFTKEK